MTELIILIGIQGSGKSTFVKERMFDTHVRINLDQLRTRHREKTLFEACLSVGTPCVIDNTNPAVADRKGYLDAAKSKGYRCVAYYFAARIDEALARNEGRDRVVPAVAVRGTRNRLERPSPDEGFDEIWYVNTGENNAFAVEEWNDEV